MPSAAQWSSLNDRANHITQLFHALQAAEGTRTLSSAEHEVIREAMKNLENVRTAYQEWRITESVSSFERVIRQTSVSSSAYETAKEHLRSAHETVMLTFMVQQR